MRSKTIIRSATLLLALLVTEAAHARIFEFNGTRQQVRAACNGAGSHLNEGPTYTSCGTSRGTGVICYDGGKCWGSARRLSSGGLRPKVIPQVPQSLIEPGSSSGSSAPASAPAPTPPPIFD